MALSLRASADGNNVELLLDATVIANFSVNGVESGVLIASDAEAQGFTNAKKLLSPQKLAAAFQGSNRSLTGTGYQRLPGGLIIQWGQSASIPGGGATSGSTNFAIAFPNSVLRADITPVNAPNAGSTPSWIDSLSNSAISIRNQHGVACAFNFIAIGF